VLGPPPRFLFLLFQEGEREYNWDTDSFAQYAAPAAKKVAGGRAPSEKRREKKPSPARGAESAVFCIISAASAAGPKIN
jgi:hypothetical protein